ncbi:MAG TPA: histidine kinase [Chitinophagaceae bacterium]|nr:histidine kinase [Chitinophagaceae bacterium]
MRFKLPEYNGKDNLVMLLVLLPVAFTINTLYLGADYFSSWKMFLTTSAIAAAGFAVDFTICGVIAVAMKQRLPEERDLTKRLTLMIIAFFLLSGLFLYALFGSYEWFSFLSIPFNEQNFTWAYFAAGIINIFLTFFMEGISRFKEWRESSRETERLNASYKQSQLNGLKSQVNPHFLFNSLNTLSSLIQEDEETAENFLNEMSKVYRYMLQNDQEQLVTLDTELRFMASYLYLLKARYGDGLQISIDVQTEDKGMLIAPLTLQVIVENAFSTNVVSKSSPLKISIISEGNVAVVVRYNLQPKAIADSLELESGLDNLIRKYELLGSNICVEEKDSKARIIGIPLIYKKGEVLL